MASLAEASEGEQSSEVRKLRTQLETAKAAEARAVNQAKFLQNVIDEQADLLSQQPKVFKSSKQRARTGTWYRVTIPDTHGCLADERAIGAMLNDLEYLKPREVVLLGDHLECGGFLAQHHTLGYVAQTDYTFKEDVASANGLLDAVMTRCPDADFYYIEGNHERRIENWCVTQALRNGQDAAYLKEKFGVEAVLGLGKRGMKHIEQGKKYCDLNVPGTIQIGNCYFTHGSTTARRPASVMLARFASNVIFGHVHRIDTVIERLVTKDCISACVGCLSQLQPLWRHTDPTLWTHGYGVQIVSKGGHFLHVTVPIVDGRSLLGPLLGAVK